MVWLASTGNPKADYMIAIVCVTVIITLFSLEFQEAYRQGLTFLGWIDKYPTKVICLCIIIVALCYTIAYSKFGGGMSYTPVYNSVVVRP